MAQNHIQEGKVMPWVNGTASTVLSGSAVVIGAKIGVAIGHIEVGEEGAVALEEVWALPKSVVAIAQGDAVYWDVADGNINKSTDGNIAAGIAFVAAAEADTVVQVKLNA